MYFAVSLVDGQSTAYGNGVAGGVVVASLIGLVFLVTAIITWWQLYTKAGKPGWAAIVPVYSQMTLADIGNQPVWMGVAAGVAWVLSAFVHARGLHGLLELIGLVLYIMLVVAASKKYDRGAGFWVLAVLLPFVAVFLVKDAHYKGADATPAAPTPAAQ